MKAWPAVLSAVAAVCSASALWYGLYLQHGDAVNPFGYKSNVVEIEPKERTLESNVPNQLKKESECIFPLTKESPVECLFKEKLNEN